jgi:hypothetical protein
MRSTDRPLEERKMSSHVYKTIEITGSSPKSVDDAVNGAIAKASKTIRNLRWFEVTSIRGEIDKKAVQYWQVTMKLGFSLDGKTPHD